MNALRTLSAASLGAVLLTVPLAAPAAPAGGMMLGPVDRQFMVAALQGGNAETDLARMALVHGHAGEVIEFAHQMIAEHPPLTTDLLGLFRKRMDVGAVPKYSVADQLAMEFLAKLPAADFDQQYLMVQIGDHLAAVTAFQTEAEDGTDPALVAAAKKALPMMQDHLQLAVDAVRHIGGDTPFKP